MCCGKEDEVKKGEHHVETENAFTVDHEVREEHRKPKHHGEVREETHHVDVKVKTHHEPEVRVEQHHDVKVKTHHEP